MKNQNKMIWKIDILSVMAVLVLTGFVITTIINAFLKNNIIAILYLFFTALFVILIIPNLFTSLLKSQNLKNKYYHILHLFYSLMPFGLIYSHNSSYKIFLRFWVMMLSIITALIIYFALRENNSIDLDKLELSHIKFAGSTTILLGMLSMCENINIENYSFPLFISPLIVLEIVYKQLQFEKKVKETKTS